jgi:D-mannonate dehydratase
MLAQSPERDREIEAFQTMIRIAGAGVPCIMHNMSILGVLRTGRTSGRGDSCSAFTLDARPPAADRAASQRDMPGAITYSSSVSCLWPRSKSRVAVIPTTR